MNQNIIVVAGGALTLFTIIAMFWDNQPSAGMKKRIARVSGDATPILSNKSTAEQSLRRRTSDSAIPILDMLIKALLPNPDKMRTRLARTGKSIAIGEYLIINMLLILVFFLIFTYLANWTKVMAVFMGIALGLYFPHMITGRMGNKRIKKFLGTFPEAIDTICRGLRSGLPITESISTVGKEMQDPIGIEFRRISDGVRMGRSLDEAMWEVAKRLDTPEYRFFIIALAIQRETGGNLAETLGNLSELLRKRRQLRLKIRAMSSEARASAMIIGSLPFLMFALLMAVNTEYMMILLNDIRGKMLMAGGLSWLGLGVFFMKQMVSFEI